MLGEKLRIETESKVVVIEHNFETLKKQIADLCLSKAAITFSFTGFFTALITTVVGSIFQSHEISSVIFMTVFSVVLAVQSVVSLVFIDRLLIPADTSEAQSKSHPKKKMDT